jgi:hypothetical protein
MGDPQEKHFRNIQVAKMAIERLHDYSKKLKNPDGSLVSYVDSEKIKQIFLLVNELAETPFHSHDSSKVDEEYISLLKESIKET